MSDDFEAFSRTIYGPVENAVAVTPDDDTDLASVTRGLMVTEAGNVSVILRGGQTVTLPALQPGMMYPFRISRVRATGTTATGIVGCW